MIALLDTSGPLETAESEIGIPCGQLLTPLTRFANKGTKFAIDNGAFAGCERRAFETLIERERPNRDRCLFVAVPDVVGDARRTGELFRYWFARLPAWPLAFVAQDGQQDLPIPWEHFSAIFIGGTTAFKLSQHAESIIRCAQWQAKWVHVGRINSPERLTRFEELGIDSFDGSGISQYSHMRHAVRDRAESAQLSLLNGSLNGGIHA
jgi:hypothetical protein